MPQLSDHTHRSDIEEHIAAVSGEHRNGGLAVMAALAAHGTEVIFGIPGTHNLELYRHMAPLGIAAITPRHEQGAGYAADGYHQVTGRPGVVITTSGPALTNALTAAATAYAESRPMILISPGMPLGTEGKDLGLLHETKDSSGSVDRLLAWSRRVRTPEAAAHAVTQAFEEFSRGRPRPVHIEVPLDVLEAQWSGQVPTPALPSSPAPGQAVLKQAAELLAQADSPLIIAGGGSRGAVGPLRRLAESLGAPVATTSNGKGVLAEDHPLSLGANVRRAVVQEASYAADVLLVIGSELGDSDLWGGLIGSEHGPDAEKAEQTVIRIDIDPSQLHKNLHGDVLICADAQEALGGVLASLEEIGNAEISIAQEGGRTVTEAAAERAAELRRRIDKEFDPAGMLPSLTTLVQRAAGEDVIIAGDSSQVTYDGTIHALVARQLGQLLYMPGYATLGYGIPAAIGAKIAAPERPVVALVGDGAAMFSLQEIMTAVECELPVVFLVVDNGGYKEIEAQMDERSIPHVGVRLVRPDFAALGAAMGTHAVSLSGTAADNPAAPWREQLEAAVREAVAAEKPTVISLQLP